MLTFAIVVVLLLLVSVVAIIAELDALDGRAVSAADFDMSDPEQVETMLYSFAPILEQAWFELRLEVQNNYGFCKQMQALTAEWCKNFDNKVANCLARDAMCRTIAAS